MPLLNIAWVQSISQQVLEIIESDVFFVIYSDLNLYASRTSIGGMFKQGHKSILSVVLLFVTFYPLVTMAIEEPHFEIEKKYNSFELRKYGSVLVAQTEISEDFENAGNTAFRILADYIFGNNISKTKISMTAPVNLSRSGRGFIVQFVMPAHYTRETLPTPVDSRVTITELPARRVAVYSYSGSWSEERYQKKLSDFRAQLQKENLKTVGEPIFARFNSPFQLWFLRRNEIWLEVAQ